MRRKNHIGLSMAPSNNNDQTTAETAITPPIKGVATRARTKEKERKKLQQTTTQKLKSTSIKQPVEPALTEETSTEMSRVNETAASTEETSTEMSGVNETAASAIIP